MENIDKYLGYLRSTKEPDITEEDIQRARDYPLSRLVEIKNNMAKCLWHEDKNPSMNCKNNFVYCYGCGASGDTITVIMKLRGLEFKEAVKALSG